LAEKIEKLNYKIKPIEMSEEQATRTIRIILEGFGTGFTKDKTTDTALKLLRAISLGARI